MSATITKLYNILRADDRSCLLNCKQKEGRQLLTTGFFIEAKPN